MLRLQAPLSDRYTTASAGQLTEWISAAKAAEIHSVSCPALAVV